MEAISEDAGQSRSVLRWFGELDVATADALADDGLAVLTGDATELVIDLSEVTFLDSTTLSVLVELRNTAIKADKALTLTGIPLRVREVMQLTGLTGMFTEDDVRVLP